MTRQEGITKLNELIVFSDEFPVEIITSKLRDVRWYLVEKRDNTAKDKFFNLVLNTVTSSDETRAFLDMLKADLMEFFESL